MRKKSTKPKAVRKTKKRLSPFKRWERKVKDEVPQGTMIPEPLAQQAPA